MSAKPKAWLAQVLEEEHRRTTRMPRLMGLLKEIEQHCPCGARPDSLETHPHVTGCPVDSAILEVAEAIKEAK